MRFKILWVGKTKSAPIKVLIEDYLKRIRRFTPCVTQEVRDFSKIQSRRTVDLIAAEGEEIIRHLPQSGHIVALDETGRQFSSEDFSRWIENEQNAGTREITFIIGGPEGLSRTIVQRAHLVLSMGKMTWTHEMCRVLLSEQLYRALCIMHKIPYHKSSC